MDKFFFVWSEYVNEGIFIVINKVWSESTVSQVLLDLL